MIVPFLTSAPARALRSAPNVTTVEHPFASSVAAHLLSMLHCPSFFSILPHIISISTMLTLFDNVLL